MMLVYINQEILNSLFLVVRWRPLLSLWQSRTGDGIIGKCGRLSQPSCLLGTL